MTKSVYAVLLNYKGWGDTIACLESLFASDDQRLRVIVCDNGSGDGSLEHIEQWGRGNLEAIKPASARLSRLLGRVPKPLQIQRLHRESAGQTIVDPEAQLILVDNAANLGFAAGNNVGLRLALAQADMDYVWVLNNDTLVEPGCLSAMRQLLTSKQDRAVCGSVIHFFDQPERIQALGGNQFNALTGVAGQSEGRFEHELNHQCLQAVARNLDYLSGCSMLLPRRFLEEVGLMDEDYFLYYEEIDWFTRAASKFPMHIAAGAHLYHREGAAIGSPGWQRKASFFADFHLYRSRFLYMKKHAARRLPLCYSWAMLEAAKCMLGGHHENSRAIFRAMFDKPAEQVAAC